VRDGFVYMRTTQGPRRVDVIYRRVDDDFLDPKAFRADSTLGCAGLLDVYRAGNITLSNAIGTGIADDKSIYPYVPKMIEFYLGEKPILNNVPTYLCREADDLKYVLAHLARAGRQGSARRRRLRHAGRPGGHQGRDRGLPPRAEGQPGQLHRAAHAGAVDLPDLRRQRHRAAPHRPAALRAVGQDVQMVPGGLTRVALKEGSLVVNSSQGGGTKDTWVLEDAEHGAGRSKREAAKPLAARRRPIMLSRTADHLFWMAATWSAPRTPRACSTSTTRPRCCRSRADMAEQGWRGLLSISELTGPFREVRRGRRAQRHGLHGARRDQPVQHLSCLRAARENARAVRGALTTEVWETQNQTWLEFNRMLKDDAFERDPGAFFEWVKFRSHLSRGVTVGTMLQDEALHFLRIGTFLERADNTARLLDVKFQALAGGDLLRLTACSARKDAGGGLLPLERDPALGVRLRDLPQGLPQRHPPEKVAELLILRPDMPRSLAACMNEVVANLQLVANEPAERRDPAPRRPAAQSDLRYGRIDEILATGLHAYLTQFLDRVGDLGAGISRDFLVPMAA
jgi:uncharacterized alpha-E superfamily protein